MAEGTHCKQEMNEVTNTSDVTSLARVNTMAQDDGGVKLRIPMAKADHEESVLFKDWCRHKC